jgi:hypothetical protein
MINLKFLIKFKRKFLHICSWSSHRFSEFFLWRKCFLFLRIWFLLNKSGLLYIYVHTYTLVSNSRLIGFSLLDEAVSQLSTNGLNLFSLGLYPPCSRCCICYHVLPILTFWNIGWAFACSFYVFLPAILN